MQPGNRAWDGNRVFALGLVSAWFWDGLNDCGMVWGWVGDGLGVVWRGLGLVWGWFGGVLGRQWGGEIWVTIRAGLLSHWPVYWNRSFLLSVFP